MTTPTAFPAPEGAGWGRLRRRPYMMVYDQEKAVWGPRTPPRGWWELAYFDSFAQEIRQADMEGAVKKLSFGRKQAFPKKRKLSE